MATSTARTGTTNGLVVPGTQHAHHVRAIAADVRRKVVPICAVVAAEGDKGRKGMLGQRTLSPGPQQIRWYLGTRLARSRIANNAV